MPSNCHSFLFFNNIDSSINNIMYSNFNLWNNIFIVNPHLCYFYYCFWCCFYQTKTPTLSCETTKSLFFILRKNLSVPTEAKDSSFFCTNKKTYNKNYIFCRLFVYWIINILSCCSWYFVAYFTHMRYIYITTPCTLSFYTKKRKEKTYP